MSNIESNSLTMCNGIKLFDEVKINDGVSDKSFIVTHMIKDYFNKSLVKFYGFNVETGQTISEFACKCRPTGRSMEKPVLYKTGRLLVR